MLRMRPCLGVDSAEFWSPILAGAGDRAKRFSGRRGNLHGNDPWTNGAKLGLMVR